MNDFLINIFVVFFIFSEHSEEESAAIRMKFPTKIPVSDWFSTSFMKLKSLKSTEFHYR